jgi:hypothetical protein
MTFFSLENKIQQARTEVGVPWGNESAIGVKPRVEAHKMRGIRATVRTAPPPKKR